MFLPNVKSCCSFHYGLVQPGDLPDLVSNAGFSGLVLADHGGVYGLHAFSRAAEKTGITGVTGVELLIGSFRFLFFAPNADSWSCLSRLITSIHLPDRVNHDEALERAGSLVALAPDIPSGIFLQKSGFSGRVFIELKPERFTGNNCARCEAEIRAQDFQPLASWPVVFQNKEDYGLHRILVAGGLCLPESSLKNSQAASPESWLPSVKEFRESFKGAGQALKNNKELFQELETHPTGSKIRPPGESEKDNIILHEITQKLLKEKYGDSRPATERLKRELSEICNAELSGYFLLFGEIVNYCRENDILAYARGSAAGSIISYLLGISIVCPIRHNLSFARFYNRLRPDPPDIDLDINSEQREQVVRWTLNKLGNGGSGISELVTKRTRGTFRTVAAAFGLGHQETDALASTLPEATDPVWKKGLPEKMLFLTRRLKGLPSHLAPHPCGIAAVCGQVEDICPLEGCNMGIPLTQLDKDGVEWMGILKMDLLGQRGLTTLTVGCRNANLKPVNILNNTSQLSPEVREVLSDGRTLGVTHIESPAMRDLLRRMKVKTLDDVARALALVRPGASAGGGRFRFLAGKNRKQMEKSRLPALEKILKENNGIPLYQEDIALIAQAMFGFAEAQADLLRRKLKKKQVSEEEILAIARKKGYSALEAEAVWQTLSGYAGYGFCKAHAITYATSACAATTMKVNHPSEHMAAVLASSGGFYRSAVYIEEARRLGVSIFPPGINSGTWLAKYFNNGIMLGFHRLRGMGHRDFSKLEKNRPYGSVPDLKRSGIGPVLLTSIAQAGCLQELGVSIPEALWFLAGSRTKEDLFEGIAETGSPVLPDYDPERKAKLEIGLLGVSVSASPFSFCRRPPGTEHLCNLPETGNVRIWGRVATGRKLEDGSGFLMLEDETGVADAFLSTELYQRAKNILRREGTTLIMAGKVERKGRIEASDISEGPLTPEPVIV